nr:PREDICTED: aldehyde dehydrogenase family 3 member B1 [Latimeria chalumnae]|eukprot:XP_006010406.2 PREDICTED: aldehyde dehydrogenase family 3 member B1 [Latimeria chalumnae]
MSAHEELLARARSAFDSGKTRPATFRISQLEAVVSLLEKNEDAILEALKKDLHKPKFESMISEISFTINEALHAINNIRTWMEPSHVNKTLATRVDDCFIKSEPFGVTLIIGAWNYPVHLVLIPLIGAIAAGNCAVLKPSEVSEHTAKILSELIPKYLDKDCFPVVCGGPEETQSLLQLRFDYIFYTGGQSIGKIIMQAAAKHLTPVTLELGGKNPCYLDESCDIPVVARRLAWSRFFNAGQTCVAPDYLLCPREVQEALVSALSRCLEEFYGKEPKASPDFGRIINARHFHRLKGLLDSGQVAIGGQLDEQDHYIGFYHALPSPPPLGGSGMGSYHGKFTFDTFSHQRACMVRGFALEKMNALRYPPYEDAKLNWILKVTSVKRKGTSLCRIM